MDEYKTCKFCGKEFKPYKGFPQMKFCSNLCAWNYLIGQLNMLRKVPHPYVTAMPATKEQASRIQKRRDRVAELHGAGMSVEGIALDIGCAVSTVKKDIEIMERDFSG